MRRIFLVVALVMSLSGVAYAGGGGGSISICPAFSEGSTISMLDSCFSGIAHFAPAAAPIRVSNDGQLPHTLTAVDGSFDTGMVDGGQSSELMFDEPGIYKVFCSLHGTAAGDGMAGIVVVGEPAPGVVAASLDLGPVEAAVTDQKSAILSAMDNQGRAMGDIRAAQDDIVASIRELKEGGVAVPASSPSVVVQNSGTTLYLAVGVALGLGLASLLALTQLRRREQTQDGVDLNRSITEM